MGGAGNREIGMFLRISPHCGLEPYSILESLYLFSLSIFIRFFSALSVEWA